MIIERPSSHVPKNAELYELLRYIEQKNPNLFYGGSKSENWAAAGHYAYRWINRMETTQRDVATEFNCSAMTVNRLSSEILGSTEVGEYYGKELDVYGSLGALLDERRLPARSVGVATGEADKAVRKRLRSLEKHDETRVLNSKEFHDVEYFWTTPRD